MIHEPIVAYNREHHVGGLNAKFFCDASDLKNKFSGENGIFESEKRDIVRHAPRIVEVLSSKMPQKTLNGLTVLDVGAGTGILEPTLSAAVGPHGRVYANDISPGFVTLIGESVEKGALGNVTPVLATVHSIDSGAGVIPTLGVDAVLLCDVYHHVEYPSTFLADIRRVLNPQSGRLFIIDFHRDPARMVTHPPEWALEHIRAGKDVFISEVEECGFDLIDDLNMPELVENYLLCFAVTKSFDEDLKSWKEMPEDVRADFASSFNEAPADDASRTTLVGSFSASVQRDFINLNEPENDRGAGFGGSNENTKAPEVLTTGLEVFRNVCYTSAKEPHAKHHLDIYKSAAPVDANAKLRPVYIHVHGGGWKRGDRSIGFYGAPSVASFAALHGFVAVAPSYRLGTYPAFMHDIVEALNWIKSNIKRYGGDADSIILSGHSAGGHIVSLLMLNPTAFGLPASFFTASVKGVVLLSGVYSLEAPLGHKVKSWKNWLFRARYIKGAFGEDTDVIDSASPAYQLQAHGAATAPVAAEPKKACFFSACFSHVDVVAKEPPVTGPPSSSKKPPSRATGPLAIPFPIFVSNACCDFGLEVDGAMFAELLRSVGVAVTYKVIPDTNHATLCWAPKSLDAVLEFVQPLVRSAAF